MISSRTLLGLALTFACNTTAIAASFDCTLPDKRTEEVIICSDKALSAYDEKLTENYKKLLAEVDASLQFIMRESQRSWLEHVHVGITTIGKQKNLSNNFDYETGWLTHEYVERIDTLERSKHVVGELTFYIVSYYKSFPSSSIKDENENRPVQGNITSFPQIAFPKTDSDKQFNIAIKRPPSNNPCVRERGEVCDSDVTDLFEGNTSYGEITVNKNLIQVPLVSNEYIHGAAHGTPNRHEFIWLRLHKRLLKSSDVFDEHSHWQDGIKPLIADSLGTKTGNCYGDFFETSRWIIQDDVLLIMGEPYDCGSYMGNTDIEISWDDLKPYLVKSPSFK